MASARILAPWVGERKESALYHVTSRIQERKHYLLDEPREQFVKMMRTYECFCGVRVLSFSIMTNHIHLLVEVPSVPEGGLTDEELLKRLSLINSKESVSRVREQLRSLSGPDVTEAGRKAYEAIRQSHFRRMWDLGEFMKVLKQRFSRWYNKKNQRKGTLWEERYHSSLVEAGYAALVVSAYIDLNPVRAGMVDDPRDYRWCSYASAVAGIQCSRLGILRVLEMACAGNESDHELEERLNRVRELKGHQWRNVSSKYRQFLYEEGEEVGNDPLAQAYAGRKKSQRKGFSKDEVEKEVARGGKLGVAALLGQRVRYFIDGAVIGSRGFVNGVIHQLNDREHWKKPRKTGASAVDGANKKLWSMRRLQKE